MQPEQEGRGLSEPMRAIGRARAGRAGPEEEACALTPPPPQPRERKLSPGVVGGAWEEAGPTVQLYLTQSSQKRLAENFFRSTTVSP